MKKVLAICLMAVMVVSMVVSVIAAPGGFVSSPSGNPAPIVIDFMCNSANCTGKLVITPYGERQTLSDYLREMSEKAYDLIAQSTDLTELNADLAKVAADRNIAGKNLAVSALFDIHVTGCDNHEEHVDFDITLDAESLHSFVGLLHMNKDGIFELVSDAKVVNNGEHLQFSVDSFSPFAIVVETEDDASGEGSGNVSGNVSGEGSGDASGDTPQTGDNSMIHIYAIIMVVSAVALVVITVISKKKKA